MTRCGVDLKGVNATCGDIYAPLRARIEAEWHRVLSRKSGWNQTRSKNCTRGSHELPPLLESKWRSYPNTGLGRPKTIHRHAMTPKQRIRARESKTFGTRVGISNPTPSSGNRATNGAPREIRRDIGVSSWRSATTKRISMSAVVRNDHASAAPVIP